MLIFKLNKDQKVRLRLVDEAGIFGESVKRVIITNKTTNKLLSIQEVKALADPECYEEIRTFLEEVLDENLESAKAYLQKTAILKEKNRVLRFELDKLNAQKKLTTLPIATCEVVDIGLIRVNNVIYKYVDISDCGILTSGSTYLLIDYDTVLTLPFGASVLELQEGDPCEYSCDYEKDVLLLKPYLNEC